MRYVPLIIVFFPYELDAGVLGRRPNCPQPTDTGVLSSEADRSFPWKALFLADSIVHPVHIFSDIEGTNKYDECICLGLICILHAIGRYIEGLDLRLTACCLFVDIADDAPVQSKS